MKRSFFSVLALTVLLAACSSPQADDAAAREEGEHGEHKEAPQQTRIAAKTAQAAGIRVAPVGAGIIADEHEVQGLLTPVEGRVVRGFQSLQVGDKVHVILVHTDFDRGFLDFERQSF